MVSHCLKVMGSLFHIVGAATEKARSPNVLHVLEGMQRRFCFDDRRPGFWHLYGSSISLMYDGACPCSDFHVNRHILKMIRWCIGSQCKLWSDGVIWSYLRTMQIDLAAAFCINCNLWIRCSGIPKSRELPQSKRDEIKACISFSVFSFVSILRILFMFRRWKYPDWHIFLTCCCMDIVLSNIMPRLRTFEVHLITLSPIIMDPDDTWRCCLLEDMIINSVLSSFSFSLFCLIHFLMPLTQSWTRDTVNSSSPGNLASKERYNCVSSAYRCTLRLCFCAILVFSAHNAER